MNITYRQGTLIAESIQFDERFQFMIVENTDNHLLKKYKYVECVDNIIGGEAFILPVELNQYIGSHDYYISASNNGVLVFDIGNLKEFIDEKLASAKSSVKNVAIFPAYYYFDWYRIIRQLGYNLGNCNGCLNVINPKFVPKKKSKKFKQPRYYGNWIQECGMTYHELIHKWNLIYNILVGDNKNIRFNFIYDNGGNMKEVIAFARKLGMTKKKFIETTNERMVCMPHLIKTLITMYKNPDKYQFIEKPEEK